MNCAPANQVQGFPGVEDPIYNTLINPQESQSVRDHLRAVLQQIPEGERTACIQATMVLFTNTMDGHEKAHLLDTMSRIPQIERVDLIQDTTPLFTDTMDGYGKTALLEAMHKIPQAERVGLIQDTTPLFTDTMGGGGKVALLNTMSRIPQAERAGLIQDTTPHFTDTMHEHEKRHLLEMMHRIPQAERAGLIEDIRSLFTDTMDGHGKAKILEAMHKIPHEERAGLIDDTKPLFTDRMDGYIKALLLGVMRKVPQAERAGLIRDTTPLLLTGYGNVRAFLLQAMYAVPQAERAGLIQDTVPLFSNIMGVREKIALLRVMQTVPQAERKSLLQDITPFLVGELDGNEKVELLKGMHQIPQRERADLIQATTPLFTDSMDGYEKAGMVFFMHAIPQEKRGSLVQARHVFHTLRYQTPESLLLFYLLPESLRTQEKLSLLPSLLRDEECRAAIVSSIEREFRAEKTHPMMLLKLAQLVQKEQGALQLHEEHAVVQQTVEILSAEEVAGENNPFSLYKRLSTLAKEPLNFQPPEFEVEGRKTAFCLEALQAAGKAFELARDQLPQDATKEAWEQVVNGLKSKIETNEAAKEQLEEVYTTWDSLWNASLSDPYLSGLLELAGEQVTIVEAQFRALLHYLLSKETQVRPGEVFSEQEETLIKQGMSIQNCSGGKKEGIALAYGLLPQSFRYQAEGLQGGRPEEIDAKKFLADIVQQTVTEQFTGTNALMQELVGDTDIRQAAHQAIYLKNLIGPLVGLNHKMAFDRHTASLYNTLIAHPREKVLEIFFRHMTPNVLVQALVRAVNSDFRMCQRHMAHLLTGEQMDTGCDWDEELFIPTRLNALGALQILQAAGYLRG